MTLQSMPELLSRFSEIDHDRFQAKSAGADSTINQPGRKPKTADDLCDLSQAQPDYRTDHKPQPGQQEVLPEGLFAVPTEEENRIGEWSQY